ncbi:MAG: YdcF family protein [Rickettsiales bacterium]
MRFLLTLIMLAAILWSGALAWFVNTMPEQNIAAAAKTEALVVLTGGADRVEHGFEMLAKGAAPVLFISGVGAHATEEEMLSTHASAETRESIYQHNGEIVLDHVARSTVSNADQAAEFIKKRNIKSIRLITASYHMKRSMQEFHTAIPGIEIVADPVFPSGFRRDEWWAHENTRRLVFSEFYKYFLVLLRDSVKSDN